MVNHLHFFLFFGDNGLEARQYDPIEEENILSTDSVSIENSGVLYLRNSNIIIRLTQRISGTDIFLINETDSVRIIYVTSDPSMENGGYNPAVHSQGNDEPFVHIQPNEVIVIRRVNPSEGLSRTVLTNHFKVCKVVFHSKRELNSSIHQRWGEWDTGITYGYEPLALSSSPLNYPYFNLLRAEVITHQLTATSGFASIATGGSGDLYNFKIDSYNATYNGERTLPFGQTSFPYPYTHLALSNDELIWTSRRVKVDYNPYLEYADNTTSFETVRDWFCIVYNLDGQVNDSNSFIYKQFKAAAESMCKYLQDSQSATVTITAGGGNIHGGTFNVTKISSSSAETIISNNQGSSTQVTFTFSTPVSYTSPPTFTTLDLTIPIQNVPQNTLTSVRVVKTVDGTLTPLSPQPTGYPVTGEIFDTSVFNTGYTYAPMDVFTVSLPSLSEYLVQISINLISEICFASGTLIKTDQGHVVIEKLDKGIHTIRGKQIQAITETVMKTEHLIRFEKDTFGKNIPSQETTMSPNHKVFYQGTLIPAKQFVGNVDGVSTVPYNNEPLYNILLDEYEKVIANNMICETLDPNNVISTFFKALDSLKQNVTVRDKMIDQYNKSTLAIEN